jgi:hypothetical protein
VSGFGAFLLTRFQYLRGFVLAFCDSTKGYFRAGTNESYCAGQPEGWVAQSTLTANLGVAATLAGDGPTVLLDTDPQGSLAAWWNARAAETPALAPATLVESTEKLRALGEANFAYAVVDTPPAITNAIRAVVAMADLVVIPAKPSPHDLRAVGRTTIKKTAPLTAGLVAVKGNACPHSRYADPQPGGSGFRARARARGGWPAAQFSGAG